jgi:hypothetical protein
MGGYFAAQALTIAAGRKYTPTPTAKPLKKYREHPAPSTPGAPRRIGVPLVYVDGSDEEVVQHSKSRTQTLQALGVVRGQCAMKPEEKIEGGGKKALAHNRAVQMMVSGYGDEDIHPMRAIATCNP